MMTKLLRWSSGFKSPAERSLLLNISGRHADVRLMTFYCKCVPHVCDVLQIGRAGNVFDLIPQKKLLLSMQHTLFHVIGAGASKRVQCGQLLATREMMMMMLLFR